MTRVKKKPPRKRTPDDIVGNGNRQAIPEDWEDEQPERFKKTVKEVHAAADLVCKTYDDLIRAAKRRLSR
ncbi:MAG: hypothetical protein LAP87_04155 [Acidobacteriia bacterium]|nr:hypothetical protein [Terriglobia bacterium]